MLLVGVVDAVIVLEDAAAAATAVAVVVCDLQGSKEKEDDNNSNMLVRGEREKGHVANFLLSGSLLTGGGRQPGGT